MKTKIEIQRNWDIEWFTPLADLEDLSFETRTQIKNEIRKEVQWLVTLPPEIDLGDSLSIRAGKIQAIMDANDGTAASFDVFFQYRKAFFEWAMV